MGTSEDPAAELKRLFTEEASEHLDEMVKCLLALEAGKPPEEATETLFRHAHSIKGTAGMVGFTEAGTIASAIEDVLERARQAGCLSSELAEPLLAATDALRRVISGQQGLAEGTVATLSGVDASVAPSAPAKPQRAANGSKEGTAATHKPSAGRSIRVAAQKVDRLLDAVGETVLHNRRLEHVLDSGEAQAGGELREQVGRSERLLEELRDAALELRTMPLSSITGPLPRAVRDLAAAEGKEVDLAITGADTPFDRGLLEGMYDLLGHLLRNAVAHGIETPVERERAGKARRGALEVHAEPRGGQVMIEVRDDGRGVAPGAVAEASRRGAALAEVLAQAGFSTAPAVSDLSGRGVGLNAVKRQVEAVGGSLSVDSSPGAGTRVAMLLPVSLALQRVLIVRRGGQCFGLPLASVGEAIAIEGMMTLAGAPSIDVRGQSVRLFDLAALLGMSAPDLPETPRALLLETGERRVAVACDDVAGEEEVVLKALDSSLATTAAYLGATILRDGRVMLILDPVELVRLAPHAARAVRIEPSAAERAREAPKVLVVDDQFTVRELQRSILRAAGYRVEVAADGRQALDELGAKGDFDMVVTDLQMPEMDGLELLEAIRSDPQRSSLPVVMVTSHGSEEDRKRGAEAGADAYIVKNEFDQQALLETVERLVGAR